VSIGMTGFSHAPIVQVTVAQQAKPEVELISIAATFERAASTSEGLKHGRRSTSGS
jgi:hypothetical protein